MAVYRFKVIFEDYDDIVREIEIQSKQTFEDFHRIIQQSTGYQVEASSSFYVSNDQWIKGDEIAFMPSAKKTDREVALMEKSKLSSFIDDPHQKFYYTYNFDRPYDFHIELIKILLDDTTGKVYPVIVRSTGDAPKPFGVVVPLPAVDAEGDFDFLHEEGLNPEDGHDFIELDEVDDIPAVVDEEQEEEFVDEEFSDHEQAEDEGHGAKEDY